METLRTETSLNDGPKKQPAISNFVVGPDDEGSRIDRFLNDVCGWNSRSRIKDLIKIGAVTVNGVTTKPAYRLSDQDAVVVEDLPPNPSELHPEDLPLEILFEDTSMIVLNKGPYMAVHPGNAIRTGTLANALAFHFSQLSDVNGEQRPGIVHRLDKDTTGVLCVARTNRSHFAIAGQFQDRVVTKTYEAIVEGVMEFDESIVDEPIGRSPNHKSKMCIDSEGRASYTRFEVLERFNTCTHVRCFPKTGRTHQIRVHLAHLGHPICCDKLYGRRSNLSLGQIQALAPDAPEDRVLLDRQALHARQLTLFHPMKGTELTFEAPLHNDMQSVLDALRDCRLGVADRKNP